MILWNEVFFPDRFSSFTSTAVIITDLNARGISKVQVAAHICHYSFHKNNSKNPFIMHIHTFFMLDNLYTHWFISTWEFSWKTSQLILMTSTLRGVRYLRSGWKKWESLKNISIHYLSSFFYYYLFQRVYLSSSMGCYHHYRALQNDRNSFISILNPFFIL